MLDSEDPSMSSTSESEDLSMSYEKTNKSLEATADNRCNPDHPQLQQKSGLFRRSINARHRPSINVIYVRIRRFFNVMSKLIKVCKLLQRTDATQNNLNQQQVKYVLFLVMKEMRSK